MSNTQALHKDSPHISHLRAPLYRFIWKPLIAFFALLWRVIWGLWGTIVIGAIVVGVIGSAAYTYLTKGHFDPIDLPHLPLIQAVAMYPLRTTFVLAPLAFLTLFSYLAHQSQQRAARDNQMGEYALKRVDQLDPTNYKLFRYVKQVYLPREADTIAQQLLHDLAARRLPTPAQRSLGICVFGRPTQGKTRLAWEAIQAELPTWTLVTWPHEREHPFDFMAQRGQHIVLWLDDLHEFANLNEATALNDLPRRFAEAQAHLIIVATCRDGDNKIQAQKHLRSLLERLTELSLTDISMEQAIHLAEGLTREGVQVQSDEFDGTPGSLLLGVQRMQGRYLDLLPSAQDILKTMKLLRSAGIYTYPESRVRFVARDLFGFDERDWRMVCETLDREHFVRLTLSVHDERSLEPVADVYLEQAVTTYPSPSADISDDWPQLQRVLVGLNDSSALVSLANACFILQRYEEALTALEQAIRLDPNNALAYLGKGATLDDLKRYEEALAAFEQAIRLDPTDALAYLGKGTTLHDLKRYEEALAAYDQAIRLDPNYASAYYHKGNALRKLKRYEEALVAFEQAIRLDPNYTYAYISKGNALHNLKRYEEALTAFEQAIRLDPNNAFVYYNKGSVLDDLKRYEEALAAFEQAIRIDPTDAFAYYNKGNALRNLKRYEEALAAFEQAIRLDPTDALAYSGKGTTLRDLKRYEEALAAYDQAIRLDPNNALAYRGKKELL
jgi:tetratricopeptide (TPR) repeat protein